LLYFGPETYVPLASVAAGAVGLLLTFWRRMVGFFRRVTSRVFAFSRRSSRQQEPPGTSPNRRDTEVPANRSRGRDDL